MHLPSCPLSQLFYCYNFQNIKSAGSQTQMIRNKMQYLIGMKRNRRGPAYNPRNQYQVHSQPHWFEQYYEHKEILQRIYQNNQNISLLANQYQHNPTVYALRQVERLITQNCQLVDEMDKWVTQFRYSPHTQPGMRKTEQGVIRHFQTALSQQILSVFNSKQIITSVNNQLGPEQNTSFTSPRANQSGISHHSRSFMPGEVEDRNRLFQEVNFKIENLSIMLRRMNAVVAAQGDLVNRIDENLVAGQENIEGARAQLQRRADREEGKGQFSWDGRVNQVITGLYILNLVLIAIFFIKNVFF